MPFGASITAMPWFTALVAVACLYMLSRNWFGVSQAVQGTFLQGDSHRPRILSIVFTLVCLLLSVESLHALALRFSDATPVITLPMFTGMFAVLGVIWIGIYVWQPLKMQQHFFAFVVSTLIAFACLFARSVLLSEHSSNGFMMALVCIGILLCWKALFANLSTNVKASMLCTFIAWFGLYVFGNLQSGQHLGFLIATGVALLPAILWCILFLEYHKQRLNLVFLMFFAGMLSTAPILFYDFLLRNGIELNFFLFRIVPDSFIASSNSFVVSSIALSSSLHTKVTATLVSFLIVGLIEELSKFWVLKKSGSNFFTSIDDVMQLAIIVAIGFAFAENIVNPSYFQAFVNTYLLNPETASWSAFLGNVFGRSILTNMVHIVSTGIMGYFFGLVLFARPYLEDAHGNKKRMPVLTALKTLFHTPEILMFKREMLIIGGLISIGLHGAFNFLVSLPQLLPGNPSTIGDIFNAPAGSWLHSIALLMPSALLYVIGGFWVLSVLFYRKENMKEFGHLLQVDTYVRS